MTGLLRRASLRFYLRHPWQLGLAIAGISLGTGLLIGVAISQANWYVLLGWALLVAGYSLNIGVQREVARQLV